MSSQVLYSAAFFGLPVLLAVVYGKAACSQDIGELFERLETPWLSLNEPLEVEDREDHIETDRDSFTPLTTTAGQGRVIFESVYSFIEHRTTLAL